jgi:hypothetical protein
MGRWRDSGLCVLLFCAAPALAQPLQQQQPQQRVYLPNPADEDWSFLKDRSKRADFWDPLKYIAIGENAHLTLSGEIRFRPESLRLRGVGERPTTTDSYFLQRYLFGVNAQFTPRVRAFAEIQSGIINGKLGSPRPTDSNQFDFHQYFIELKPPVGAGRTMSAKIGRHELTLGSTRLISASPGLNVKRSFDGATVTLRASGWHAAAAVAQLVPVQAGTLDDWPRREQLFWGASASRKSPRFDRGELGAYYLGIDRETSTYAQGIGPELRHTLGVKWSVTTTKFDWNYDTLYQWGRFADAPVRAWGFATETGFTASSRGWRPRLSVRTDVASGDADAADPKLQAFNPLFPGNAYSGAVGLLGPTNLTDFTPALTMFPRRGLMLSVEAPSYWRSSEADGLYSTDQRLLIGPTAGTGRYVGTNPAFVVVYQATRHLQLQGVMTRFLPGRFLDQTFVADGFGFFSTTALYRF